MGGLAFLVGTLAGFAAARHSAPEAHRSRRMYRDAIAAPDLEPVQLPPVSTPGIAAGAFALGAFAIGALAIGALAIGRLEIRKARLRKVEIDSLTVRRFGVSDGPKPAEPTGEAS